MHSPTTIHCVIGPTASGKSAAAIALAQECNGEVISVDSRQVYRTLDIGTEKTSMGEMAGIPHHLIDIREPEDSYSAGDFVHDANIVIADVLARGKTPILAGGTHFYFDALLHGLPEVRENSVLRESLSGLSTEELYARVAQADPVRAERIDPYNRRRLVRALEIIATAGVVPERIPSTRYTPIWTVIDHEREVLRARIERRLEQALDKGLIEEVQATLTRVGEPRLKELGLEYRIVGEYILGERTKESLLPALTAKLWRYAKQQKSWITSLLR